MIVKLARLALHPPPPFPALFLGRVRRKHPRDCLATPVLSDTNTDLSLPPLTPTGALVVTMATLAVTHHSSMPARSPDPLAAVETTADHGSSPWSLREEDEEEPMTIDALDEIGSRPIDSQVSGMGYDETTFSEPRAPKRRAERVSHTSPFESESEELNVDLDNARAGKTAKRTHHRTSSSGDASDTTLDLAFDDLTKDGDDFEVDPIPFFDPEAPDDEVSEMGKRTQQIHTREHDGDDAMDLEEYAGLARARRVKLEHFEAVLADTENLRSILHRAVAKVAKHEQVKPIEKGDISRQMGFEFSASLADEHRGRVSAGARADALKAPDASIGKSETDEPTTKDTGFDDASWAEDDYRTNVVGTKDVTAENDLDPVVSEKGVPSKKPDDDTMSALLKHVEDNKQQIAENVIQDDGELDEDAFIHELVREGAIVEPDLEPEKSKKTNAGNYLDGEFDEKDLKRIIKDDDKRSEDLRVNTFPKLAAKDVEDNARDEIPEAFVDQDVDAMEDAFDNLKETLANIKEDDAEAPAEAPESAPDSAPEDEAQGPAATPEAEASAAAQDDDEYDASAPGPAADQ